MQNHEHLQVFQEMNKAEQNLLHTVLPISRTNNRQWHDSRLMPHQTMQNHLATQLCDRYIFDHADASVTTGPVGDVMSNTPTTYGMPRLDFLFK